MNRYKTAAGEPLPHNSTKLFALLSETRRFKGWETGSMIVEHYKLYRGEFGHLTEWGQSLRTFLPLPDLGSPQLMAILSMGFIMTSMNYLP